MMNTGRCGTSESGPRNPNFGLDAIGFKGLGSVVYNADEAHLVDVATGRGEVDLTAKGGVRAITGQHTGRSPNDKFIVRDPAIEADICWHNNAGLSPSRFYLLMADFLAHAEGCDLFVQDLFAGADPTHAVPTRVVTEYAWHSLFIRSLLIRPEVERLASFMPKLTIIDLPTFRADPARHGCRSETIIAIDLKRGIVLIGGSAYAGEIKKSVFTVVNHWLPQKGVLPMHCAANADDSGRTAVFFGLSGTGKTTLSADPARTLIGDDEHGWSENGIFNIEGGCYAKTLRLSKEAEPAIHAAAGRPTTVLENVALDVDGNPDFDDASRTENGRAAYSLDALPNASESGRGQHPDTVVMLTADAFGVLPPIAKLTPSQAMYHFLSGYTAKVAGTERGVSQPQATFSACFGAPFLPRRPAEYGALLRSLIARHGSTCWLINTGWTGGAYGEGMRMPIAATRAILNAALDGSLETADFRTDPYFAFAVPTAIPGVDDALLDPRSTWADAAAYDRTAERLVTMFVENFARFENDADSDVLACAPGIPMAAQ